VAILGIGVVAVMAVSAIQRALVRSATQQTGKREPGISAGAPAVAQAIQFVMLAAGKPGSTGICAVS